MPGCKKRKKAAILDISETIDCLIEKIRRLGKYKNIAQTAYFQNLQAYIGWSRWEIYSLVDAFVEAFAADEATDRISDMARDDSESEGYLENEQPSADNTQPEQQA